MTKNIFLPLQKSTTLTSILLVVFVHRSNTYGYDGAAPACNPKAARRGRAQILETIPCDLTVQTYCSQPGSLYPWHAVRRFVHENQGLMRRMYGDLKHITVLRNEVNNNDIEFDDVEQATARYSRSGWKRNKYLYSDVQKAKVNNVVSEPHFRPTSTSPRSTVTPTTKATTTTTTTTPSTTEIPFISDNEVDVQDSNNVTTTSLNVSSVKAILIENDTEAVKDYKINQTNDIKGANKSEAATISTTLRIFLPSKLPEASITPPDNDGVESSTEYTDEENVTSNSEPLNRRQTDQLSDNRKEESISDATPKQANVRPSEHMEGQLYQDVVPKEEPIYNSRGV